MATLFCSQSASAGINQLQLRLDSLDEPFAAPPIDAVTTSGERIAPGRLEGRILVVNFWTTWCRPCRREMPDLEMLSQVLSKNEFLVLGIAMGDTETAYQAFLESTNHNLTFPIVLDTDKSITEAWPVTAVPTTFIVNADGLIVYKATGWRRWANPEIVDKIRGLKDSDKTIR